MTVVDLLKFDDKGLIPAVIQDWTTKEVLTLCYLNKEAVERSFETGMVYVFRRSKGRIMLKGETSGCTQAIRSVCIDCEGNSLLIRVDQKIAGCHEGYFTCYFRQVEKDGTTATLGKRLFDPNEVYKKKG
ncbi:MAG: phosphoribosyl-AMP cyclohydrolase [Candidatus Omnitrophica bacterium]|nr:phosphoribosyl-AMP cyclohydrolase [Candidatus Omnitrophota bacterium]